MGRWTRELRFTLIGINMETIYQLRAKGSYKSFNQAGTIFSKKVFRDKVAAETYKDAFKLICCGDDMFDLIPESITVDVSLAVPSGLSD